MWVWVCMYVCMRGYSTCVRACMYIYTCLHLYTHSLIVCPLSDTVCSHTSLPLLSNSTPPSPPPGSGGVGTAVIIGVVVAVVMVILIIIITVFATVLVCVKHKTTSESGRKGGGGCVYQLIHPVCVCKSLSHTCISA